MLILKILGLIFVKVSQSQRLINKPVICANKGISWSGKLQSKVFVYHVLFSKNQSSNTVSYDTHFDIARITLSTSGMYFALLFANI